MPSSLATAISKAEGFGTENAPTITAYNNPGALFADGQPQQFSSLSDGYSALETQIQSWLSGTSAHANSDTTISELAQVYTGGDNPDSWASNVSSFLGVTPDTTLGQLQSNGLTSSLNDFSINGMNKRITGKTQSNGFLPDIAGWLFSTRFVFGILGILLIWGGILGFDKTKDIIVNTAKAVKDGAEVAAL
jgi:hypothetical protein